MANENATQCCPEFDPAPWDGITHQWKDKLFLKDSMPVFFHVPFPWKISKLITSMWNKAQQAEAAPELKDFLLLANDPSPWKCDYYLGINKEIPGSTNVKLSGTFISKVFDGPYSAVPKWIKEMNVYLAGKGLTADDYFFYYTTCPRCAKKYGHNYVVAFARIKE